MTQLPPLLDASGEGEEEEEANRDTLNDKLGQDRFSFNANDMGSPRQVSQPTVINNNYIYCLQPSQEEEEGGGVAAVAAPGEETTEPVLSIPPVAGAPQQQPPPPLALPSPATNISGLVAAVAGAAGAISAVNYVFTDQQQESSSATSSVSNQQQEEAPTTNAGEWTTEPPPQNYNGYWAQLAPTADNNELSLTVDDSTAISEAGDGKYRVSFTDGTTTIIMFQQPPETRRYNGPYYSTWE